MSNQLETKDKTREEIETENESLKQVCADASAGYSVLRDSIERILAARSLAANGGQRLTTTTIYQVLEAALVEAEVVQAQLGPNDLDAVPMAYCSICNRFLDHDEEASGRCMTCDAKC